MKIGELARASGVRRDTIRFYEKRGLLIPPKRNASGYRIYEHDAIEQLHFIRCAQEHGFTLEQTAVLISLKDATEHEHCPVRELTACKLADVEAKLATLQAMREALVSLVRSCGEHSRAMCCPIIESMSKR